MYLFRGGTVKYENRCRYSQSGSQWIEYPFDPLIDNLTDRRTLNDRIYQQDRKYAIQTAIVLSSEEEHPLKKVGVTVW